jgi:hypothetical protein
LPRGSRSATAPRSGAGANGTPKPATPLAEPDRIEELRAEADLPPYDEYLAEMETICAESAPGG